MNEQTPTVLSTELRPTLYIAFELSNTSWKLAFTDGYGNARFRNVVARDLDALAGEMETAKQRFALVSPRVVSCYEAGRDGFWLHRWLVSRGIESLVVDSSSIDVNRRARRAKTDRLDAKALVWKLVQHHRRMPGEPARWSVVRVPSADVEDGRRLHRERERLVRERTGHGNRIHNLLAAYGVVLKVNKKTFTDDFRALRLWDGGPVPTHLMTEVMREYQRWVLVYEQIRDIESEMRRRLADPKTVAEQKGAKLQQQRGIGLIASWVLAHEFFWRDFANVRQVGAAAGLAPTPWASGGPGHEQGISKSGNPRIRSLMVQIGWLWLRLRPDSVQTHWFQKRTTGTGKRMRRVAIVATARKLLIALWKYVESDVPIGTVDRQITYKKAEAV